MITSSISWKTLKQWSSNYRECFFLYNNNKNLIKINVEISDLYPRVLCTSKSEWDKSVTLECLDIKICLANLFYKSLNSIAYCTTSRTWERIQLRFELFTFIYPRKVVFPITWFLLVTVQPIGFRGKWSSDSSSPPQKTSNYHLCDWKTALIVD